MFVLIYRDEDNKVLSSKVGEYNDLRKEVEDNINKNEVGAYKAEISKIAGKRYILGAPVEKKAKKK